MKPNLVMMTGIQQGQIEYLQDNLASIREEIGWSAGRLAGESGIDALAIDALENKTAVLSVTDYLAIRSAIDGQMERKKGKASRKSRRFFLVKGADSTDGKSF